jgi:hypothetical protein
VGVLVVVGVEVGVLVEVDVLVAVGVGVLKGLSGCKCRLLLSHSAVGVIWRSLTKKVMTLLGPPHPV